MSPPPLHMHLLTLHRHRWVCTATPVCLRTTARCCREPSCALACTHTCHLWEWGESPLPYLQRVCEAWTQGSRDLLSLVGTPLGMELGGGLVQSSRLEKERLGQGQETWRAVGRAG